MNLARIIAALTIAAVVGLLSGCLTETTMVKKDVDPVEVVKKQIDLGIGYLVRGDYQRAKESLNKALAVNPDSPLAHTTFGLLFQREGETELAEEHHRKAVKLDPTFSQARNNYGAFLFAEGRYQEAIVQLEVASEDRFYVQRSQTFENLGRSYLKVGDRDKAESAFKRAVELNTNQTRALLELAEIRFDQQAYVESSNLYRQFSRVGQHNAQSLWLCVRLADRFSNADEKASCELSLRNLFPASEEYRLYRIRYGP
ncbi:MAG: type IV pilus biogenesis/stability protein PilW [Proteobacteria bacterium]|jgi:type IV pilus assembly protein PilF|nr:type IV pilus biogenesis/stability protein PilW [Pseudomonadota bacterium]MDA1302122.1 type IV pilus biogenesis/stability protein PilW [Pseudomonadota bacterium]